MSWYTFARPSSHVTTDYLYLALLLLTSIAISFSISIVASHTFAGLVFLSGRCLHLTFYLLFKWFHIFNHTAVKPNAQIHSKCTSSTFWKKNWLLRGTCFPTSLLANKLNSHKHNQADCGKRILFALTSFFFNLTQMSERRQHCRYFISHTDIGWSNSCACGPWHGRCISCIPNAM